MIDHDQARLTTCQRLAHIRSALQTVNEEGVYPLDRGNAAELILWLDVLEAVIQRIGWAALEETLVARALEAGGMEDA